MWQITGPWPRVGGWCQGAWLAGGAGFASSGTFFTAHPQRPQVGLSSSLSVCLLVSKPPLLDFLGQGHSHLLFPSPLLLGAAVQGSSEVIGRDCPQESANSRPGACAPVRGPLFFTQPTLTPSSCLAEFPEQPALTERGPQNPEFDLLQARRWLSGLRLVLALIWM